MIENNCLDVISKQLETTLNELSTLKDLFLRRLVDDKIKNAAIEQLSKSNDSLIKTIDNIHFQSLINELILVCDRIEANSEDGGFALSIREELIEVMARRSVYEIEAQQTFDPKLHNAVKAVQSSDEVPANTIVSVVRRGYIWGDRVLRPVDVIVTSNRIQ